MSEMSKPKIPKSFPILYVSGPSRRPIFVRFCDPVCDPKSGSPVWFGVDEWETLVGFKIFSRKKILKFSQISSRNSENKKKSRYFWTFWGKKFGTNPVLKWSILTIEDKLSITARALNRFSNGLTMIEHLTNMFEN